MKLTKEHIGKKIKHMVVGFGNGRYAVLVGFQSNGRANYIRFDASHCVEDNGKIIESGFNHDDTAWEFYEKSEDYFDFSVFGCNEQAVKDLVKNLDKRYGYKGDK